MFDGMFDDGTCQKYASELNETTCTYIDMASIVMAHAVMAYTVMAYVVMVRAERGNAHRAHVKRVEVVGGPLLVRHAEAPHEMVQSAEIIGAALVVARAHHVRQLGGDRLYLPHERLRHAAAIAPEVVRQVADVQHCVDGALLRLFREQGDRGGDGSAGHGCPHVAVDCEREARSLATRVLRTECVIRFASADLLHIDVMLQRFCMCVYVLRCMLHLLNVHDLVAVKGTRHKRCEGHSVEVLAHTAGADQCLWTTEDVLEREATLLRNGVIQPL